MNETEVVRELSRRTALPEAATGAVFNAVRDLLRDGVIGDELLHGQSLPPLQKACVVAAETTDHTDPTLVDELIARARRHPLGVGFLLTGFLGSVAIALGAHAFTVEAARERLRKQQMKEEKDIIPA